MDAAHRAISEIERLAGHDVQLRNIAPLAAHVRGSLGAAALSLARHPRPSVAIITGFFLAHGAPPNCETDGPPGAVMLAAGLHAAGVPCRLATDLVNARVLRATMAAAGLGAAVPLDIVSMHAAGGDDGAPLAAVRRSWLEAELPISHVVAIERCGPSRDGTARNALGHDISAVNAPLERLFEAGPWITIGIGDLGNEIGMGSLPYELVAASVPNGARLWCTVSCDYPIVCGISNWAGASLLGAMALSAPRWSSAMLAHMTPAFAGRLLEAAVRDGGAVSSDRDGGPPRPWLSVDGLPWGVVERTYRRIYDACGEALGQRGGSAAGQASEALRRSACAASWSR